jgi:hypothetical protein
MKDLWIRVFDFHEVLDDMELGFTLIPSSDILKNCPLGKPWTAWHALKPASELSSNDRTYGEIELVISVTPFVALHPTWTVHQEARPKAGATIIDVDADEEDVTNMITTTLDHFGGIVGAVGDKVVKLTDKAGGKNEVTDANADGGHQEGQEATKRFQLQVYKCAIGANVPDMKREAPVWVEYVINNVSGQQGTIQLKGKSELKTWPVKDMGSSNIRGISLEDVQNANSVSVVVKVYSKATGLTIKIGEASAPLSVFMPDFDAQIPSSGELDWKNQAKTERLILRRTAAFRRNRKRIVGEIFVKAIVSPDASNEGIDEVDNFQDELDIGHGAQIIEEDLSNVVSMLAESGFVAPEPLPNFIAKETFTDCTSEALFWYILSKNSPLLNLYAAKRNYLDLKLGEWRWGGRDRKSSYPEESLDDRPRSEIISQPQLTPTSALPTPIAASQPANVPSQNTNVDTIEQGTGDQIKEKVPLIRQESLTKLEQVAPSGGLPEIGTNGGDLNHELETTLVEPPVNKSLAEPNLAGKGTLEAPPEGSNFQSKSSTEQIGVSEAGDASPPKTLKVSSSQESSYGAEECPHRLVTYKRPPEFPVKELNVKEIWRLKGFGTDKGFWLEIEGTTDEPTYGKQMSLIVQIVATNGPGKTCQLSLSCKVNWLSRPLAASFVERQAIPATTANYKQYLSVLRGVMGKKKTPLPGEEVEEVTVEAPKPRFAGLRFFAAVFITSLVAVLIVYIAYVAYINGFDPALIAEEGFPFLFGDKEEL